MSVIWYARKLLRMRVALILGLAIGTTAATSPAFALVKIFDGFGDADRDNNGTPLEAADVDVSGSGNGEIGPYPALNNGGTPAVYPADTMIEEVTAVENAADEGIRWYSIGGFSGGATPAPRAAVQIISDAAGNLPETNPSIGYNHSLADTPGTRFAEAIDDGLALAFDSKGRANAAAGFFNNRIELGDAVDDEVRISFDFRLWLSASALNTGTNINHIPAIGEFRFGVYQDTDNQLGQTNTTAGVGSTSAVWGQSNGNFRGDSGTVGANGDAGWFVRLPIDDSQNSSLDQLGPDMIGRINEETNLGTSGTDKRILNGATDFVASAPADMPFIDVNKVYNLSLSLKRYDDPASEGTADTIYAQITVTERSSGEQWGFGNYERVVNATTMVADGFSSDSWDYIVMATAGETNSDDFDWLIDNFKVELFGSNAVEEGLPGDFNDDGVVDAADYTVWRNNLGAPNESSINNNGDGGDVGPGDYTLWKQSYGDTSPGSGGLGLVPVPEPGTLALLLGVASAFALRRSTRAA